MLYSIIEAAQAVGARATCVKAMLVIVVFGVIIFIAIKGFEGISMHLK